MDESRLWANLASMGESLHHIKSSIAVMALCLERIEEMAAEMRAEHKKYGFKYSPSTDPDDGDVQ